MCGVAGFVHAGTLDTAGETLSRMAASMVHRGPDDEGTVLLHRGDVTVGLCTRRLAVQDPSPAGHQPMRSPSGNVIAFNGEIYNVDQLRRELTHHGYVFRSTSDTEVVLYAYDQWGVQCIRRLRGMFALVIWNEGERSLLLARDRIGIKPLYRSHSTRGLVFASELRTLALSGLVVPTLCAAGLTSFLRLGAVQEPYTVLHDVSQVLPGHFEIWQDGRLARHEYWSLEATFHSPPTPPSRIMAVEMVREKLEDTIRTHLVSDVPLGVFLSGGIDSTALVALLTHVADEPPHTVSVSFPEAEYTEEQYINATSSEYGTHHTSVHLDSQTAVAHVADALKAMDQPTIDGVNTFIVSRLARQSGLTVALSGVGGDELFGGYDTFSSVPRLVTLQLRAPSNLRSLAARMLDIASRTSDRDEKLKRWLRGNGEGLDSAYALHRELFAPAIAAQLYASGLDSLSGLVVPHELADARNTVSYYELAVYLKNMLIRDTDVMSMANSLEVRVPLIDHELIELVAGLPGKWKSNTSTPKALLVDAVRDLVPAAVSQRKKMGFVLPYEHWLQGPLQSQVEDALLDESYGGAVSTLLDPQQVRNIWKRFCAGDAHWSRPWGLFVLKSWGETHRTLLEI